MTLVGLDLNSTRARAVHGPASGQPKPLALEDGQVELPLALALGGRSPVAGRTATAVCRKEPHLVCSDFLPHLGGARTWAGGRHRLDAGGAFGAVCEALAPRLARSQGVALTLPTYLDAMQRSLLSQVAAKARWRVLATAAAPVAAALAAYEQLPWAGLTLVGDVDGHAFTWSAVTVHDDRATLLDTTALPALARGAWLRHLLDGVAMRCVRTTRRDPRESADAEQGLYDQLADRLTDQPEASRAELVIRAGQWFQNLMLDAAELRAWCAPLAAQAVAAMHDALALAGGHGPTAAVLLTAPAGRLPGLAALLEDQFRAPAVLRPDEPVSDFGDGLLIDDNSGGVRVHVLEPDALARAAHALAARAQGGELAAGHHEEVALPAGAGGDDSGPARLHFRGRDHLLSGPVFTLGRDPACDLVFESELYPTVSARHCEIVLDRRIYLLRDRSRHGTLVNDCPVMQQTSLRPGDWIRLGPAGPLLRFLGQPGDPRTLVTA
jgi:hypothetical protein